MRAAVLLLTTFLALPAHADDRVAGATAGIMFNTSISVNAPLVATDPAARIAEETAYRQSLYRRSAGECDELLATIASSCVITAVNVSTQINSNPGQPDYLYATANISMTVELK
jgi:hypothetical protein